MLKGIAESKGEYQSRYDEISKLYEGIEGANIEEELTADLVGDYLFTDREFISRLSAEKPGVFKKIFDEIKYLCRVATAGSKEAKELEKVKKTFEEFYRESKAEKNTAEGGEISYSLSDSIEKVNEILYNKSSPLAINNRAKTNNNSSLKWVYDAEIFSYRESKLFHKAISEINTGKHSFGENINTLGEYMIPIDNKIVFTDGNYDSPYIREIVEVLTEYEDEFQRVRERIFNVEKGKSEKQDAVRTIEQMFGKGFIVTYRSGNDGVYDWQNGKRKGKTRSSVIRNHLNKQFRAGNDRASREAPINDNVNINETSSTGDVFSLSSKDTTPKKYGDYAVYGEDVMLEGEAKDTGKRELTAPTRESIAEGKQAKENKFPMLDEDDMLPIRRDLKNDLLSRSAKSFGITKPGDYVQVQRQVFDTLEKEGFFSDEGSRSRTVTNSDSSMQVEINKSGIFETFSLKNYGNLGRRKKAIKLAVVRNLPEIIQSGKPIADKVDNYHNKNSTAKFAYIEAEVQVEGQPVSVKIDIKKSPQKNKFWMHRVKILENANGFPADTSGVLKQGIEHIGNKNSISNTDENVNSKKDDGAEQILGESQLRTAELKKNNIRDAWKGFLRSFVSKGAEVETYALKGKNRAVEDKYKMWKTGFLQKSKIQKRSFPIIKGFPHG